MKLKLRAKHTKSDDACSSLRCIDNLDGLLSSNYDGLLTISEVFERAVKKYGNEPALGTRQLLEEVDEKQDNGRVFKKARFGEYKWTTFNELYMRVVKFGKGLSLLGLKRDEKCALFLETREEWIVASHACFRYGFPLVTVYATLGEESVIYALKETEVTHIITSSTLLMTKLKNCFESLPKLNTVVFIEDGKKVTDIDSNITAKSYNDVLTLGESNEAKSIEIVSPEPEDIGIIMYTSGTSGDPKGVLMSNLNFVSGMTGIGMRVPRLGPSDTYIAYLPLAHVLELAAENIILCQGGKIGFSSPLTLTDKSTRIMKGTKGDATALQPTLMAAVPEIMERMRKAVMQNISEGYGFQQSMFQYAYDYKLHYVEKGQDTPFLNRLIFKKTKALLGGKVRAMLSGGAPLDAKTQRFMNVCMCCPVGQGYGLTETCGAGTVTEVDIDFSTGRAGTPVSTCDIRLVPWEEGGYSPSNKPRAQGEVWIGGPSISQGYFKKPEKTAEDYYVDEDGQRWFKTGDIGEIHEDGGVKIIDRKKDLIKLSHGEYIAVGNIEAKLKTSPLIDNVWVYANSSRAYAVAFLVPNEKALLALAKTKGLSGTVEELVLKPVIEEEMKAAMLQAAKVGKLQKFEIPQKTVLEPNPWLAESNLITAAFKLRRKALEQHYSDKVQSLYAS